MCCKERSFTMLSTCMIALAVMPHVFAQSTPGAPDTRAEPYRESGAAVAPQLPLIPQPECTRLNTSAVPHSQCSAADEKELNKAEHLRLAAQHLTAAGKPELARIVSKEALLEEKLAQIRQLQAEVAELRGTTATDQAVTIHVTMMELQVTKMRELGFDFQTADGTGLKQITGNSPVKLEAINGLITALRQNNLIKVLAEPTLVTVSGRPASFQSGGEFPIVVPQSMGTQSVEYRQFGTRLDCVAKVLDNGRIRLELRSSVSELDTSRSVTIQERTVPGLRTRSVDTAFEMDAGQTMVLSGLSQKRPNQTSDSDEVEETSLLVTVTANLGVPVAPVELDASARY